MKVFMNSFTQLVNSPKDREFMMVKKKLFNSKKKGDLFFRKDTSELNSYDHFNIYHVIGPSPRSEIIDAFPVPKYIYTSKSFKDNLEGNLKIYYKNYYSDENFSIDDYYEIPYIAKETVWFYKKDV